MMKVYSFRIENKFEEVFSQDCCLLNLPNGW